jgi:hypothetical protein
MKPLIDQTNPYYKALLFNAAAVFAKRSPNTQHKRFSCSVSSESVSER